MRAYLLVMLAVASARADESDLTRLVEVTAVPDKAKLGPGEPLRFDLRIRNVTKSRQRIVLRRESFDARHPLSEPFTFEIFREGDAQPVYGEDFVQYHSALVNLPPGEAVIKERAFDLDAGQTFHNSFEVPAKRFHRGRMWTEGRNRSGLTAGATAYRVELQLFFSDKYSAASREQLKTARFSFTHE